MGKIIVKDSIRYREKDAARVGIPPVRVGVPVEGTDQWAEAEAEKARAALQAELAETRRQHEAELEQERAAFEQEIAERRKALDGDPERDEKSDDAATKVEEPETTKVREPETVKRGRGRQASDAK